jgi:hypothetical protein
MSDLCGVVEVPSNDAVMSCGDLQSDYMSQTGRGIVYMAWRKITPWLSHRHSKKVGCSLPSCMSKGVCTSGLGLAADLAFAEFLWSSELRLRAGSLSR